MQECVHVQLRICGSHFLVSDLLRIGFTSGSDCEVSPETTGILRHLMGPRESKNRNTQGNIGQGIVGNIV